MGKKFLLDTNMLVLAVRESPIWNKIEEKYAIQFSDSYISIVSQAEILSLAIQFDWGEQKLKKLNSLLSLINIIPIETLPIINAYIDIDLYSQKRLADIEFYTSKYGQK